MITKQDLERNRLRAAISTAKCRRRIAPMDWWLMLDLKLAHRALSRFDNQRVASLSSVRKPKLKIRLADSQSVNRGYPYDDVL